MTITLNPHLEQVAEVVSQFSLARNLTLDQVRIFCQYLEEISFADEQFLYHQNSPENSDLIILLDGTVDVIRELPNTSTPAGSVAKLAAGDTVGILGFVDARPHSATVIATSDVTALSLSRKAFAHLSQEHPEIAIVLLRSMIVIAADIAYEMLGRHADAMLFLHGSFNRAPLPEQYSSTNRT